MRALIIAIALGLALTTSAQAAPKRLTQWKYCEITTSTVPQRLINECKNNGINSEPVICLAVANRTPKHPISIMT